MAFVISYTKKLEKSQMEIILKYLQILEKHICFLTKLFFQKLFTYTLQFPSNNYV